MKYGVIKKLIKQPLQDNQDSQISEYDEDFEDVSKII